jgi:hypothetical protein
MNHNSREDGTRDSATHNSRGVFMFPGGFDRGSTCPAFNAWFDVGGGRGSGFVFMKVVSACAISPIKFLLNARTQAGIETGNGRARVFSLVEVHSAHPTIRASPLGTCFVDKTESHS